MSKYYCSKLLTIHKIYNFVPYRCRNNSENTATQQRKRKINKNLDDENAIFLNTSEKSAHQISTLHQIPLNDTTNSTAHTRQKKKNDDVKQNIHDE